jgi:hypothetical protein
LEGDRKVYYRRPAVWSYSTGNGFLDEEELVDGVAGPELVHRKHLSRVSTTRFLKVDLLTATSVNTKIKINRNRTAHQN